MTTLVKDKVEIPKAFPLNKHTKYQVLWILKNKGALTTWQIIDVLNRLKANKQYRTVTAALDRLREEGRAGVVNYTLEDKRQKRTSYGRYDYYRRKQISDTKQGQKLGGQHEVEVWALVNNRSR